MRQFLKPLWNTYAFYVLYANVERAERRGRRAETELDRWIRSRLAATTERVIERMDDYDTTFAGRAIAEFVDDLSNWYVRRSRRRFWDGDPAAFATLRECLLGVSQAARAAHARSSPTRSTTTSTAPSRRVHLCDFPEPGARDEELEWRHGRSCATRSSWAARRAAHAKVKVRQPLREAVVVAADRERERDRAASRRSCSDELNVKAVRYVSEADELGRFELKPNYRALGPALRQADAAGGRRDRGARPARGCAPASGVGRELRRQGARARPGRRDSSCSSRSTATRWSARARTPWRSNLELDDELRREGLAREVVHAVQAARKNAGLEVEDRIALTLGGDEELLDAARAHEDYVAGETLATSLELRRRGGRGGERRDRGPAAVDLGSAAGASASRRHRPSRSARSRLQLIGGIVVPMVFGLLSGFALGWNEIVYYILVGPIAPRRRLPRRDRAPQRGRGRGARRASADSCSAASSCSGLKILNTEPKAYLGDPQAGLVFVTTLGRRDPRRSRRQLPRAPRGAPRVRARRRAPARSPAQPALRQRADDLVGDLAVLEEQQRRDRHHVVLRRRLRVVVHVQLDDREVVALRLRAPRGAGRRSGRDRTRAPRSRRAPACRPRAPQPGSWCR